MNAKILNYINECEGWKVAIKSLHWDSNSLSQHELCDDIASEISDFEDLVSEVEQSMSGKLKINSLNPTEYKITSLKSFVEDVISSSQNFLNELEGMGEKYVGIKSECETFIGTMQRKLYLVNFTLKEDLRRRIRSKINESMPKNIANHDEIDKFSGRRPKTIKARINQIYRIVKKYGIDSRVYKDEHWQAIEDYYRAITSLGCEVEMKPCASVSHIDSLESDGGYCDYGEDGMPRSKQYAIKIMFEDGMNIEGYVKCMAAGTVSDPFSRYDTCIVLWPKNSRMLENKDMNRQVKLTEGELWDVLREATVQVLKETPLNYDIDNFSGRWTKSEPSDEEWALADSRANGDYLDDPFHAPNSWDDDEWIDGDKDMENDYSWGLYHRINNVGKSPVDRQHDIMNAAQDRRDHAAYWTDKDNERGRKLMDKWINGKRDADELGDVDFSYDPYKYNESKEPMKVTEGELREMLRDAVTNVLKEKIEIKPSKEGTFTAAATKHGKSVQGFASQVLNNKDDYSPAMVKKANFARNAKRWNKNESVSSQSVINEEDSPIKVMIDGSLMTFKNSKEYKKFLEKRKQEKIGNAPKKQVKRRKQTEDGIGSQSDPRTLAKNIADIIYDKALKSIKTFIVHSERSFGPNAVRSLVNLYKAKSGTNLFNDYNVKYNEINSFVNDIQNWGAKNEHAVYERCSRLSNSLKDLCDILSSLANTTQELKSTGKLQSMFGNGTRNILVGSGDGRELGLYGLVFAKNAKILGNIEHKLYEMANLLEEVSRNGRDPFDYDI